MCSLAIINEAFCYEFLVQNIINLSNCNLSWMTSFCWLIWLRCNKATISSGFYFSTFLTSFPILFEKECDSETRKAGHLKKISLWQKKLCRQGTHLFNLLTEIISFLEYFFFPWIFCLMRFSWDTSPKCRIEL